MEIDIPQDVTRYVKSLFRKCNKLLSQDLSRFPSIREESLDSNLILYFSQNQAPVRLASNWIVRIDTYFIGGGRHFGTWEVADIGIMMIFRHKGKVVKSKLVMLQSKKLYANILKYNPNENNFGRYGLGSFIESDEYHNEVTSKRLMEFKDNSKYLAFKKNSSQQSTMGHFERRWGMDLHYLFYNPIRIPLTVEMPIVEQPVLTGNKVGCRVIAKIDLDSALSSLTKGQSPSYSHIRDNLPNKLNGLESAGGWKLETFVANLMLQCKAGLIDDSPNFESLSVLMQQKQRPMAAALSISFNIN